MEWDSESWAADMIVKDGPRDFLEKLIPMDGTSTKNPVTSSARLPSAMFGFRLVKGAAGAGISDPGVDWITPLGQKVVDRLLLRRR